MKRILTATVLALTLSGCSSCKKSNSASPSATAAAGDAPGSAAGAPAKPFVQKGVPEGKVICGYVQDDADPAKCSAVVDAPEGVEVFKKAGDHYARIVKGRVVPSCPTDNVVGICDNGMGLLTNYSGPKWTAETAKKDCTSKSRHKWVE